MDGAAPPRSITVERIQEAITEVIAYLWSELGNPLVLLVALIGVYAVNASPFDLMLLVIAGGVGYVLRKFSFDVAPLLLALVLGERMETSFRRALTTSDGSFSIFVMGPAAKVLLAGIALIAVLQLVARMMGWRRTAA